MAYLLDAGILLRLVDKQDRLHDSIRQAVVTLAKGKEQLFTTTQNVAEFWNVATRPLASNGLGLSATIVVQVLEGIVERTCALLVEPETLYSEFKRLGLTYGFGGKQAHDARLVAMMLCWGIDKIVTLNDRDFRPYLAEGIVVVSPESLAGGK